MDTIYEEGHPDLEAKKKAKENEIAIVEVEYQVYYGNDKIVRKYFQISCAFVANMMMTCYGLICPASGFLIPQLEDPIIGFGINKEEGSWLASIMILGSLTGSLCGGWQSGKFGRKKSLIFDSSIFIIGIVMSAFAPNFYTLLIARMLLGHSSASAMVATPIYTSEISQPQIRKITGSFTMVCYTTGYGLAVVFGALFPWRYALGVVIIVPLFTFILLFFCPESPVWLLTKGKKEEAKSALERLRGSDNTEVIKNEYDRISTTLKMRQQHDDKEEKPFMDKAKDFLKLLIDPTFMKPLSLLLVIFCLGFEWCGFPAIGFYMVPLLMSTDIPIDPYWAAAMLASYRALLCIFGSSLTGKFKRRPIYISCCGLVSFGTLLMASYCFFNQDKSLTNEFPYAKWIPIIAIVTCYSAFALGLGSIPYMFQGEILPSHARSLGSGLLGIIDNLVLFISTKMVPTLFDLLGIHGAFLLYSSVGVFVGIYSYFHMPETSGLSLEQIEEMYRPVPRKRMRRISSC